MAASFQQRGLRFTFKMRTGSFSGEGEPDTVVYDGFRSSVQIQAPGGWQYSTATASIKGMALDVMQRLTIINFTNMELQRNEITIEATGLDGEYSVLFIGTIANAYIDYMGAPDVAFNIEAYQLLIDSTTTAKPTSWPGANKVSEIATSLAGKFGYRLENHGVESTVTDQVLTGSYYGQLKSLCEIARCEFWPDARAGAVYISPLGSPLNVPEVAISPDTGLIGWPTPNHLGVDVTCLYNPEIRHGAPIKLTTSAAVSGQSTAIPEGQTQNSQGQQISLTGKWYVIGISTLLDCETPGGAWFQYLTCSPTPQKDVG